MHWTTIRLELARTPGFPEGSPSRHYVLQLPLDENSLIDEAELRRKPAAATVRRIWPEQAILSGYVVPTTDGWAISYRAGEDDDEALFHLETHPLQPGNYLTVTEPDGDRLPFRVAALEPVD